MRGHRHRLLTVAGLAGILALGAGFPASGVSAEKWVRSVCTSLSDWADALVEAQGNHDLEATDPEESKDALVGYLTEEGLLREVCVGTGKRDSVQYYLERPRAFGDSHGQAPMMWTSTSLLR